MQNQDEAFLLLLPTASFCPVGPMVTGTGSVVGGAVGITVGSGSVKEETSEFQNAIFSESIFFLTEGSGLNEIYCSSWRVYAGQLAESSVGFLHETLRSINNSVN